MDAIIRRYFGENFSLGSRAFTGCILLRGMPPRLRTRPLVVPVGGALAAVPSVSDEVYP